MYKKLDKPHKAFFLGVAGSLKYKDKTGKDSYKVHVTNIFTETSENVWKYSDKHLELVIERNMKHFTDMLNPFGQEPVDVDIVYIKPMDQVEILDISDNGSYTTVKIRYKGHEIGVRQNVECTIMPFTDETENEVAFECCDMIIKHNKIADQNKERENALYKLKGSAMNSLLKLS